MDKTIISYVGEGEGREGGLHSAGAVSFGRSEIASSSFSPYLLVIPLLIDFDIHDRLPPHLSSQPSQGIELSDPTRQQTRALILVPTRELAEQVTNHLKGLTSYCEAEVLVANVAGGASTQLQR